MAADNVREVFRVMLRMRIESGKERDFGQVWLEIGDSVTSHPANLGQSLSRDDTEHGVYYIVSDWVDEDRFREFETSNRHVEHRGKLHPYRTDGSMTTMHVAAYLPGAAGSSTHLEWEDER